jgi:uncharacterized protein
MRSQRIINLARGTVLLLVSLLVFPAFAQQLSAPLAPETTSVVNVEFQSRDATLAGSVVIPPRVVAGVVIVHGSGKETRNLDLARALAQRGVATLTYDKRGTGKSGGTYLGPEVGTNNVDTSNLELLAEDAIAAMKELSRRLCSPRTPLGLMGMSQAGWIIPIAAASSLAVNFMVIWSGPLVTTLEQLRFQFLTEGREDFWEKNTEARVREHVRSAPDRYRFSPTDPVASLRKLSIPGLWLYGRRDLNVPTSLSIERLELLASAGKRFKHVQFPDAGHQLPFDAALAASMEWLQRDVLAGPPQER